MKREDAIRIVREAQAERAGGAGNDCFEALRWRRSRTTCLGALMTIAEDMDASELEADDELRLAVVAHVENELKVLGRKVAQYRESHPAWAAKLVRRAEGHRGVLAEMRGP